MTTRSYASPRRAQAAGETREAILGAALELFEARGYADVGMNDVAARAGVSLNTIYVSVGKKPQLLLSLLHDAANGTEIDSALARVHAEDSPTRIIDIIARGTRGVFERHSWALGELYDNAAACAEFADAIAASEQRYRDRLTLVAKRIVLLRPSLDAGRVADILWFYFGFRPWRELRKLQWSWDESERWLTGQAESALR